MLDRQTMGSGGRNSVNPENNAIFDIEKTRKTAGTLLSKSQRPQQTKLQQVAEGNEDDSDEEAKVPTFNDLINESQQEDVGNQEVVPSMEDLIEEAKMKDSGLMKSVGNRRGPSMRASGSVFVDARFSGVSGRPDSVQFGDSNHGSVQFGSNHDSVVFGDGGDGAESVQFGNPTEHGGAIGSSERGSIINKIRQQERG